MVVFHSYVTVYQRVSHGRHGIPWHPWPADVGCDRPGRRARVRAPPSPSPAPPGADPTPGRRERMGLASWKNGWNMDGTWETTEREVYI